MNYHNPKIPEPRVNLEDLLDSGWQISPFLLVDNKYTLYRDQELIIYDRNEGKIIYKQVRDI